MAISCIFYPSSSSVTLDTITQAMTPHSAYIYAGTIRKLGAPCSFLFAFRSNNGSILHHFGDKAILKYLTCNQKNCSIVSLVCCRRTWTHPPNGVAISSCHEQIGSLETEHLGSPLHECGIDWQPTSDSCIRCRHSGAVLRHFYSLLLTELR